MRNEYVLPNEMPDYVPSHMSDGDYHRIMDRIFHDSFRMTRGDWQELAAMGLAIGNCSFLLVLLSPQCEDTTASTLGCCRLVSRHVRDTLLSGQWGYQVEVDGLLAVLLCYQFPLEDVEETSAELSRQCVRLAALCQREYGLEVTAYIGLYIPSAADLSEEFEHLQKYIAYCRFFGDSGGVKRIRVRDKRYPQVFSILEFADRAAAEIADSLPRKDHTLHQLAEQQLGTLRSVRPNDVDVLRDNYKYLVEQVYRRLIRQRLITQAQLSLDEVAWRYLVRCKCWEDIVKNYDGFLDHVVALYLENTALHSHSSITLAMAFLHQHYREPSLSVADVGSHVGMKPSTVCAAFKKYYGTTIFDCLRDLRLEEACRLLRETQMPVKQVCQAAGFGSVDAMFRVFRRQKATTPGEYRQMNCGS